jgi:hypothetical protein
VLARMCRALILILVAGFVTGSSALAETHSDGNGEAPLRFVDVQIEPEELSAGSVATVRFAIEDQFGNSVSGLRASGALRPPSTAQDTTPPPPALTSIGRELSEPGYYEVSVALNQSGRWWIEVRVDDEYGRFARYDHFTVVNSLDETPPSATSDPIFLRADDWDHYFRIDPDTGSVTSLEGGNLFQIGDRWWIGNVRIQERGSISSDYGGTWRMHVDLRDALSGNDLTTIDLGNVRANVFSGSADDPAIATAMTIAPDGSAIYVYWARQLGEGWVAHLVEADPLTGEIRNERMLNGAISSNGFWAELYLRDDGNLVIAEQVVELASVSGYRLSIVDRHSLEIVSQIRQTDAREDPLTHCMLAYPGPIGRVAGEAEKRYAVCSPPQDELERALVTWDPLTGEPAYTRDLADVVDSDPDHVEGIADPSESTFYAVNTYSMAIAEVDLNSGESIRMHSLLPDEDDDPSTLDRFFDWVFGMSTDEAVEPESTDSGIAISPDGQTLYVVANPPGRDPGILVIDTENLEIVNSLMSGEHVEGITATHDGRLIVIQRENGSVADEVTVLDRDGNTYVSFTLPGQLDVLGARR